MSDSRSAEEGGRKSVTETRDGYECRMVIGAESSRGGLRRSVYSVWFAGEPGLWEVGWWGEQLRKGEPGVLRKGGGRGQEREVSELGRRTAVSAGVRANPCPHRSPRLPQELGTDGGF